MGVGLVGVRDPWTHRGALARMLRRGGLASPAELSVRRNFGTRRPRIHGHDRRVRRGWGELARGTGARDPALLADIPLPSQQLGWTRRPQPFRPGGGGARGPRTSQSCILRLRPSGSGAYGSASMRNLLSSESGDPLLFVWDGILSPLSGGDVRRRHL